MLLIESEFIINFQVYYGRWKIFQIFWYFSNSKYQIIESILKLYDIWLKMISRARALQTHGLQTRQPAEAPGPAQFSNPQILM